MKGLSFAAWVGGGGGTPNAHACFSRRPNQWILSCQTGRLRARVQILADSNSPIPGSGQTEKRRPSGTNESACNYKGISGYSLALGTKIPTTCGSLASTTPMSKARNVRSFPISFQEKLKPPNHLNKVTTRSNTSVAAAVVREKPVEGGVGCEGCHLSEVQLEIIDICVRGARAFGVSRSLGEIFGLMFCSRRPLNFDDVVRSLGISSGSASHGLRRMCRLGVIRSCYVARDRRVYYVLETSLRSLVIALLQENILTQLSLAEQQIQRLRTRLNDDSAASLNLAPRVELLASWNAQFRDALKPLLEALA